MDDVSKGLSLKIQIYVLKSIKPHYFESSNIDYLSDLGPYKVLLLFQSKKYGSF